LIAGRGAEAHPGALRQQAANEQHEGGEHQEDRVGRQPAAQLTKPAPAGLERVGDPEYAVVGFAEERVQHGPPGAVRLGVQRPSQPLLRLDIPAGSQVGHSQVAVEPAARLDPPAVRRDIRRL
jgi:hypothetical protein